MAVASQKLAQIGAQLHKVPPLASPPKMSSATTLRQQLCQQLGQQISQQNQDVTFMKPCIQFQSPITYWVEILKIHTKMRTCSQSQSQSQSQPQSQPQPSGSNALYSQALSLADIYGRTTRSETKTRRGCVTVNISHSFQLFIFIFKILNTNSATLISFCSHRGQRNFPKLRRL